MQLFYLLDIQQNIVDANSWLNRYWFFNPSSTDVASEDVAISFITTWMNVARSMQSGETTHNNVYVKEVIGGLDEFLGNVSGGGGVRTGDASPDFTQYSFYAKPAGPVIRRGGKRMGGVAEGDTNNNTATAGVGTYLAYFAALLAGGLEVDELFLTHVIERNMGGEPVEHLISPVIGGAFRQISTQRSRLLSTGSSIPTFVGLVPGAVTADNLAGFVEADYQAIVDDLAAAKAAAPSVAEQVVTQLY